MTTLKNKFHETRKRNATHLKRVQQQMSAAYANSFAFTSSRDALLRDVLRDFGASLTATRD